MSHTKSIIHCILLLCLASGARAQVSGVIADAESGQTIPGANVFWAATTHGTVSDTEGRFVLEIPEPLPLQLVVSHVGFTTDTLTIASEEALEIFLSPSVEMKAVEISENRNAINLSSISTLNAESINRGILRKAACCNLSESFETTASVDVVLNDAVSGTRKIRMLGLDGVYVSNLFEGVPIMGGLGGILGFDQIPGPWISSIAITKGVGSVVNGYESMTGLINLEFIKPEEPPITYFDLFANDMGRLEANVIQSVHLSDRLSTALFVSGNHFDRAVDDNGDGFVDSPMRRGVKVMNRWKYMGDHFRSQISGIYTREERSAGQSGSASFGYRPESPFYGFGFGVEQWEIMAKSGILFSGREDRSIGITALASGIDPEAHFGHNRYVGKQRTFRLNTLYKTNLSQYGDHGLEVGGHFVYDSFDEQYVDSGFARVERVPGISAEYSYDRPRFTLLAGLRHDWHNIHGNRFSPRVHLKYDLKPLTSLRAAAGRGFRSGNVYADRIGMFASSRKVIVSGESFVESSWNSGVSFLHKFEWFGREAVFNADYFYTTFEDRLVVDRDSRPGALLFYNLDGHSQSHSIQADVQSEPLPGLGVKFSYKFQKSQVDYLSGRADVPLLPRHRALGNLGYTSPRGLWYLDFTINYYGAMRFPNTEGNPEAIGKRGMSPDFFLCNAQITRTLGLFEVYAGVENIGNFVQGNAIVDAENPFGNHFDATMIYGPLEGRTVYVGVRFTKRQDHH